MEMSSHSAENMEDRVHEDGQNKGIREFLTLLSESDLAGLLGKLTNNLVQFGSVPLDENKKPTADVITHAINSIVMYAGNSTTVLDKARVTKSLLAKYLNQKGVKMTIPATKNSLCTDVLNYWGQTIPNDLRMTEHEDERATPPVKSAYESQRSTLNNGNQESLMTASTKSISSVNSTVGDNAVAIAQGQDIGQIGYGNAMSLQQRQTDLGQQLGKEFAAWYYERLNTLTDFTTSHFWADCNFRLEMTFASQPDNTCIDEIMGNAEATCAKIKDLVKLLYFNPETTDAGIRGYINPHGLAHVMVCGSICQRNGPPVGVFEQIFGLVKDPQFGNNYRIKFSVLRLHEGGSLAVQNSPPELFDSGFVGIVEEMDSVD